MKVLPVSDAPTTRFKPLAKVTVAAGRFPSVTASSRMIIAQSSLFPSLDEIRRTNSAPQCFQWNCMNDASSTSAMAENAQQSTRHDFANLPRSSSKGIEERESVFPRQVANAVWSKRPLNHRPGGHELQPTLNQRRRTMSSPERCGVPDGYLADRPARRPNGRLGSCTALTAAGHSFEEKRRAALPRSGFPTPTRC